MSGNVMTPPTSTEVAIWLSKLPAADVACVHDSAFWWLAHHAGVSEADLAAEWADRAATDPDCQVVIPLHDGERRSPIWGVSHLSILGLMLLGYSIGLAVGELWIRSGLVAGGALLLVLCGEGSRS